jgi:hypothetical protein
MFLTNVVAGHMVSAQYFVRAMDIFREKFNTIEDSNRDYSSNNSIQEQNTNVTENKKVK